MKKIGSFILVLLTIILLGGVIFFGYVIYKDLIGEDTVQTVQTEDTLIALDDGSGVITKTEKKNLGQTIADIFTFGEPETFTYSEESSSGNYFYEQLNENQKIIYNGLQENKEKMMSGTYSIEFGDKFHDTLEKENGGDILGNDYQAAIEAFTHDNADMFYLDISKMYLNMETTKKAFKTMYNVYIKPVDGGNYFAKGFTSEEQVRTALNKIEQVRDEIKAKLGDNAHNNIKRIHDYLVDNINYDSNYESLSPYTIYGALVEKRCVCEGYARAFKYLADSAGINNVLMQGTGTNSEGATENHAWNAVKLYGTWYLVDTTWDDPIIVGIGYVSSNYKYRYFLKGTNTFYKDHTPEMQFTDNGKVFSYPSISTRDY